MADTFSKILDPLIKDIAGNYGFTDYKTSIKTLPFTGGNYTSTLYLITLSADGKDDLELFAKVMKALELLRKNFEEVDPHEEELFVYKDLIPIFMNLQDKHHVPHADRFRFPKLYAWNWNTGAETLITENLIPQNFEVFDRFKSIDWEYSAAALRELAKFHALSFAYELEDPEGFSQTVKTKKERILTGLGLAKDMNAYYSKLFDKILQVVDAKHYVKVKKFIDNCDHEFKVKQVAPQRHNVLAHGDYRQSNILVRYQGSKVAELVPVDYQTIYYGSPINDILYFIFTGSDEKFRLQHFDDLLQHYYQNLGSTLALLGYDVSRIYPKADFDADVRERLLYGLLISFCVVPFVTCSMEEAADLDELKSMEDFSIAINDAAKKRIRGIVNDFVRWGLI